MRLCLKYQNVTILGYKPFIRFVKTLVMTVDCLRIHFGPFTALFSNTRLQIKLDLCERVNYQKHS